ncbi:MAG: matrixin family metalloprotease [Bryobacteraceae bacterium]|nr:matrixin family metalloprotease [Bryobacteraceae bacterium]
MATGIRRTSLAAAVALACAGIAPAYYHFVHFLSVGGALTAVPEKFDLRALVDNTVRYYINEQGPESLAEQDSLEAVISQIRAAGQVWNDVPSSRLRVAFGGLTTAKAKHSAPYIEVMFDEIPPGLLALGGPTTREQAASGPDGPFVPIARSVVILNRDLSKQRSSSESFFLTAVHELGHAIGLQHTLSSSVMSTSLTRSTTKAAPLAIDDVAGISLLYPGPRFAATTGAIEGRVTLAGSGVHLASVVALSPQGPVISALTDPDGAYKIEGIPPGQYYVYVHPLPPPVYGEASPANIVLPRNAEDKPLATGPVFETQFYPGVKNLDAAVSLSVKRGAVANKIDFSVRARDQVDVYAVTAYSFPGRIAVPQGYLSLTSSRQFLVASGFGLAADGAPTKGLRASVIGGSASIPPDGLSAYKPDPRYLQIDLDLNPFSSPGSRHLLFSLNSDIYVRPAALSLTQQTPPFIDGMAAASDSEGRPVIAIAGRRLTRASRILFDGVAASVTGTADNGIVFVQPPAAPSGHRATVVILNPDGQSSLFLQGSEAPQWEYGVHGRATFSVTPSALPGGAESMIDVRGSNTFFQAGQTELGFGSTDIVVRGLWVLGPDRLLANIQIAPDAAGALPVTVVSGLQIARQPLAFQVQARTGTRVALRPPARDQATGRGAIYAGRKGAVTVTGLPASASAADLSLTLDDKRAAIVSIEKDILTFETPASLSPGPVVARLRTPQMEAFPIVIDVGIAPPEIVAVSVLESPDAPTKAVDAGRPAQEGDLLNLLVTGLGDVGESDAASRVSVALGGVAHSIQKLAPLKDRAGFHELQFFVGANVAAGKAVELVVAVDGRESEPVAIPVAEKK